VDAIEYYSAQLEKVKVEFDNELQNESARTGIVFVTVHEGDTAIVTNVENELLTSGKTPNSMIVKNFELTPLFKPITTVEKFDPRWWSVSHAPYPRYIIWSNLSRKGAFWYLYWFIINSILLLITIFLTTPTFIVQTIENLNITNPLEDLIEEKSPILASYIPTFMLWTFSALVPVLVWYAGYMEKHWTFSSTHYNIMQKCYGFLLLMVLVMPSLGMGAISTYLERLFSKDHPNEAINRFECIFLADNGSFFVNYIIFGAFLSCGLELLRIPEFLRLAIRLCFTSQLEQSSVKEDFRYDFEFGLHLAWMLVIFTIQASYSLAVPVINVFGFMYISIKHLVDRYNLFFVTRPSRISKRIIDKSIELTMLAVRMSLMFLLFFTLLRYDSSSGQLTNRPIAVVLLTIVVLLQTAAFLPLVKSLFSEFPSFTRRIDPFILLKGNKHILDHDTLLKANDYKPNLSDEINHSRPQSRGSSHTSTI